MKEAISGWRGPLWGRREGTCGYMFHCSFSGQSRNRITFKEAILDIQRFECSFVSKLWSWDRLCLGNEAISLIGSLECLASS